MKRYGKIEKYGSGFIRIREAIRECPTMALNVKEAPNGFLATLAYKEQRVSEKMDPKINEGLNEGLKILFRAIKQNQGIQAKDLPQVLDNRPLKTIERQISQLIEKKLIVRKGSRKTGGYYLLKNENVDGKL